MIDKVMVSITCPTYNQEDYIAEAIESFLMQKTNFKYEILINDDASTDNTKSIIKKYEEKYPDIIKAIYQKENQYSKGIKVNYEYNIKRAKGKYIAICEGDDYWTDPYKLQKQVDYMESNPDCTLCMHTTGTIDAKTKESIRLVRPYDYSTKASLEDIILGDGGFVSTNSLLFPRKLFTNIPDWYFNCPVGDYPLQIFLAYKGYAYYIDENMSVYRVNSKNSWTKRINDGKIENKIKIREDLKSMLDEFNIYSNNKYNDCVCEAKIMHEYKKYVIKNDLKGMRKPEFRKFYSKLNTKSKLYILIDYYFPYLIKAKNYLRSKYYND